MKIRTITSGISLKSVVKDMIKRTAEFNHQAKEYFELHGFEVQEIRISTNSWAEYLKTDSVESVLEQVKDIEDCCKESGVSFFSIGYVDKPELIEYIPEIIKNTSIIFCSSKIASTDYGIDFDNVRVSAEVIKRISEETPEGYGNLMYCAQANALPGTPFFPAAYHEGSPTFSVGLENSDLVMKSFIMSNSLFEAEVMLKQILSEHVRSIEEVAIKLSIINMVQYGGIDVSIAPSLLEEESLAFAYEKLGLGKFGSSGTLAISAVITKVLKSLSVRQCGYSGLMLPVCEDYGLAQRACEGAYSISDLLLYSSVCGCGLDCVPIPGDTSIDKIESILLDVATLSIKLDKPLSARLFPIPGKEAGDMTQFNSPYLVNSKIMPVQ
ncbi:MAG: DUF711 family protein [Cyanobacteriota bacterium]